MSARRHTQPRARCRLPGQQAAHPGPLSHPGRVTTRLHRPRPAPGGASTARRGTGSMPSGTWDALVGAATLASRSGLAVEAVLPLACGIVLQAHDAAALAGVYVTTERTGSLVRLRFATR